jgi:hypothetical protein
MNTPSPGPGWWLASDGRWYPQRWEYDVVETEGGGAGPGLYKAMVDLRAQVNGLGQEGWEVVNFTVQSHYSQGVGKGTSAMQQATAFENQSWSIVCLIKRPIAP